MAVFCYLIPLFEQKQMFFKILESSFISLQTLLHAKRDLFCKLQMMIRRLNTSSTARIFVGNVITVSQLRWERRIQVIKWIPECLWCDLFFPLIQHSFMLLISSSLLCHFSVYAMSRHNRSGIIVCSLPYGVLIATYSFPCTSVKAIEIVENTCEQLRRWQKGEHNSWNYEPAWGVIYHLKYKRHVNCFFHMKTWIFPWN